MDLLRQLRECLRGRVCLMGLGNEDYGDDGFGVRLAEELRAEGVPGTSEAQPDGAVRRCSTGSPASPLSACWGVSAAGPAWELERVSGPCFRVMVAGSVPERRISRATSGGFQHIVFLDAVEFGGSPGDVVFLNSSEMQARFPQISTHKISLSVLAMWAESTGATRAWLLGVQPESIKAGQLLSARVKTTLEALKQLLLQCAVPDIASLQVGLGDAGTRRTRAPGQ